jgi:adenosine kinase
MAAALICGSIAYDTIMVFRDRFKNHILPDKIHILNVSFLVPDLRREFGGCAGNIAYNLKLLGGEPLPLGTAGRDFAPYAEWMDQCGIDRRHVRVLEDTYTAQAFITTDLDDNQITAFHPGAMSRSHEVALPPANNVALGIVSPDGRDGMLQHAEQFVRAKVPFVFDPGQAMPLFNGPEFLHFVDQATWVTVNDYEAQLLQEKTGIKIETLAERVKAIIVTLGGKGSRIYTNGKTIEIPVVQTRDTRDPTGCGDAYRAGILYGLMNDFDWETTGRIASLLGAIKIAHAGTQNHRFTREEFFATFKSNFGYQP